MNQYLFDVVGQTISRLINGNALSFLCEMASYVGDGNSVDLLTELSRHHENDGVRWEAFRALARLLPDESLALWEEATRDRAIHVRGQAERRLRHG